MTSLRFTPKPTYADGTPRIYVGMHRPPFEWPNANINCTCGGHLQTVQAARDHWQQGHWDVPLYRAGGKS